MLSSIASLVALLALTSASPIERRAAPVDVQYGPCLTAACPLISGLSLTTTNLPAVVGGDLTCLYLTVRSLTNAVQTCVFSNGLLNAASSGSGCSGAASVCTSCVETSTLNSGRCVINSVAVPALTVTVTPTITSTVTKPVTTITPPKITNLITGTETLTVKVTLTLPNPLPATTQTKTLYKTITKAISTATKTTVKTTVTGKASKTQYALSFPTNCCPDVYVSLKPYTSAAAGIHKRADTITVTALNTVTAVVTEKIGTITAAAATVKVTVPAAKISATVSVTAKQSTVKKTSTILATITGGPKTITNTVTTKVPNTGTFTSTITPPNVCVTAAVDTGLTGNLGLGGVLTPLQSAVQSTLQSYSKLGSAGVDVLVLCGSKILAFSGSSS